MTETTIREGILASGDSDHLTDDQYEWVHGLVSMTAYLIDHPQLIPHSGLDVAHWFYGEDTKARLGDFVRALGRADKNVIGSFFEVAREFGPHKISGNADREGVCTRVEVGTETVEVPDPDAPKVPVTRPVYEWKCPESLLAPDASATP